jgi:hypothetical protein
MGDTYRCPDCGQNHVTRARRYQASPVSASRGGCLDWALAVSVLLLWAAVILLSVATWGS